MSWPAWKTELDAVLDRSDYRMETLSGGCVGDVALVWLSDSEGRVAKVDESGAGGLEVEARMLRYLKAETELPVPEVLHVSPTLLLMEWIQGRTGCGRTAEVQAAEHLARLHAIRGERFGFLFPTRIGGLEQLNPWSEKWLPFFAEHRMQAMAQQARAAGRIDARVTRLVERVAGKLEEWLDEPDAPRLLHGDVWSGNILSEGGRVTAFLDPALYFGHPEVEMAFTTMFSTFSDRFYIAYGAHAKRLDDDFFETRRHLYNIYPLLVHTRLFGGKYLADLKAILARFA